VKSFIDRLLRNPVTFEITSIFVYAFYCLVYAVATLPSLVIIYFGVQLLDGSFLWNFIFTILCFLALYVFFIFCAIFVGFVERLLTLGFKPGAYAPGSPVFFRWLVYSGLHLWLINIVLPFLRGNNWIKIYMRVAGAKVGKETFINTKDIYDAYLLEIGSEVVVGGESYLNCHLFEHGYLKLDKIIIGDNSTIAAKVYLTPGTRIGKNSAVGINTFLRRNTEIADGETLMTPPGMNIRQIVKLMKENKKTG